MINHQIPIEYTKNYKILISRYMFRLCAKKTLKLYVKKTVLKVNI